MNDREPPLREERRLHFGPELASALRAAEPSADIEGATLLGEGWGSVAWRIPRPGGDLALRIPKPRSWWAPVGLEQEAKLLPFLERQGLPVPQGERLLRGSDGVVLGAAQSVIEGSPATRLPSGRARARFANDVGAFLARLHALPVDRVRALGVREPGMWDGYYAPMIAKAIELLPRRSAGWLEERARAFLESGGVGTASYALIHTDCSKGNLRLGSDGTLEGVIDWADAMIGDPALDLAALMHAYTRPFVATVVEAYVQAGGALDGDWERRAAFYLDVAPLFGVLFAEDAGFPEIAQQDRRRFAAAAGRASEGGG